MRQINDHVTVEEALRALHARARPENTAEPEIEGHLRQCRRCTQMVEECQQFMSRLYGFDSSEQSAHPNECLSPSAWGELVAGLISEEDAAKHIRHAASCADCTHELMDAMDALGSSEPPPDELQHNLSTATARWQKDFAATIAEKYRPVPVKAKEHFVFSPERRRSFIRYSWAFAGVAVVLLTVGIVFSPWLRGPSAEKLIYQAYSQQRTIEMRMPGAGYGPVRVQRANGRSQINSPRELLEAEVLIKRGLETKPEDPNLLRQKAEADLLTWNYQPAIETLNHAVRLQPHSFELLVDMATAYFERAEATANPADYEAGLQSLGDAIRLKPGNSAALFNRAIMDERLFFYDRAIADWEQVLKIEKDPGWLNEAQQRLDEIRSRQRQRGLRRSPETLSPAQFGEEVAANRPADIEEYLEAAESHLLPGIAAPFSSNEYYQAAQALADNLQHRHSDYILADLLLHKTDHDFQQASQLLGRSSVANHKGHFEDAYQLGAQAASLFRRSDNAAGSLAAQFEQSYALQFEAKAVPCRKLASQSAQDAHQRRYALLEVQMLLEEAICSNMNGEVGAAKDVAQHATAVAKDHGYQSFYLRGLTLLAVLESEAGDDSNAWSDIHEGLGLYWKSRLPAVRAYSFYTVLDRMAESMGHANVQFAAAFEALRFRAENSNHLVEASGHARLGYAAMHLGDLATAESEFARAREIFTTEPQTESVRWRELEARINLSRVQFLRGAGGHQSIAELEAFLPEVHRLSNRYVEFQYYETLAQLKMSAGDVAASNQYLEKAIAIAEAAASSLTTWRERVTWMDQHRLPFIMASEFLLDSGKPDQALATWRHYRELSAGAPSHTAALPNAGTLLPAASSVASGPDTRVLTYAFGSHGLMIWVRHPGEVHSVYLPVSRQEIRRTAENFLSECARPDSDMADLQADAHSLYSWLIQPVSRWLPEAGHLIIEPDGALGSIPFDALIDASSAYLGTRYSITMAYAVGGKVQRSSTSAITASERALIVAAPAGGDDRLAPPPGALAEAQNVASRYDHPELLLGREATIKEVERELGSSSIFHFAGHASSGRSGAAMLMADGTLGAEHAAVFDAHKLDKMKLAVFSACATAQASEVSESNSLVSKFLQAGARNVVASRWNVDSMATSKFIDHFYTSLLSGQSVAEALQSSASAFRHARERSHPYYWAAFAAFGSA